MYRVVGGRHDLSVIVLVVWMTAFLACDLCPANFDNDFVRKRWDALSISDKWDDWTSPFRWSVRKHRLQAFCERRSEFCVKRMTVWCSDHRSAFISSSRECMSTYPCRSLAAVSRRWSSWRRYQSVVHFKFAIRITIVPMGPLPEHGTLSADSTSPICAYLGWHEPCLSWTLLWESYDYLGEGNHDQLIYPWYLRAMHITWPRLCTPPSIAFQNASTLESTSCLISGSSTPRYWEARLNVYPQQYGWQQTIVTSRTSNVFGLIAPNSRWKRIEWSTAVRTSRVFRLSRTCLSNLKCVKIIKQEYLPSLWLSLGNCWCSW